MSTKKHVTVILGICGSIAAYKSCDIIRKLKEHSINVKCILTECGSKFITPLTIQTLSNNPVYTDMFDPVTYDPEHISLAKEADLVVIAPATADTIAKLANGFASDLLSSVVLSTKSKILICPAMNTNMWLHKATQNNIARIKGLGYRIVMPVSGKLACGDTGIGKLADTSKIVDEALKLIKK